MLQAQEQVSYEVVADTSDVFVHVKGNFMDADMWVSNMNIGSSLAIEAGLNRRIRLNGSFYWAHFYDGVLSDYDRNLSGNGVLPAKTAGPTSLWDVGLAYNYKINRNKASVPLGVSSSQEKFLGQTIAVTNKHIYVTGTMRKYRAITFRIENFSTLVNMGKNTDKTEFYVKEDGADIPISDANLTNLSTGGYYFTQMMGTSGYIGWRSISNEAKMVVKTSKGKLKNFSRTSMFFEYSPVSIVRFGDIEALTQNGKIYEVKSDQTIGRAWRAGFDVQASFKRTTSIWQISLGQRPGFRRLFLNGKVGLMLYSYVNK